MKKHLFTLSVSVFMGVTIYPFFVFAQNTNQRPTTDLQALIRELQSQIQILQQQVVTLQAELGKQPAETTTSPVAVEAPTSIQEAILPEFNRSLSRGSSGDDVRKLQEFLAKDKEIYPESLITGFFGPRTEAAVRKWQKKNGIDSIGIVGPKTISKLQELGRGVVQGLLERGAGASGIVPPGLLTAPGIQKKFEVPATTTIYIGTTTQIVATTTPVVATTTPSGTVPAVPAIPAVPAQQSATPATPAVATITSTSTPDTTVPVISSIQVADVASTSFTVTWTTNEDSDSQVEYGTTSGYGSSTVLNISMVTYHSVPISGLSPSTSYQIKVKSKDVAGNLGIGTFTAVTSATVVAFPSTGITSSYSNPTPNRSIPSLTFVGQITGLYNPAGVNVSPSGSIYVADYHNDNVKVYNSSFQLTKTIGSTRGSASGQFSEPWDIGFDSSGRAFISDTNNNRVQIFDSNGNYVSQILLQKESHQGVAFNSDGYLYVSGRAVEVFNNNGQKITDLPLGENYYPRNIAIDKNNRVYFSNWGNQSLPPPYDHYVYDNNNSITIQTPQGELIKRIPLGYQPHFIDVDDLFRIWVADHTNGKIKVYDSGGNFITEFQLPFSSLRTGSSVPLDTENPVGLEIHGNKLYASVMNDNLIRVYSIIELTSAATTACPAVTINGYFVPSKNNGESATVTTVNSVTNGIRTASTTFTCNNGSFTAGPETADITCNSGYTSIGIQCVASATDVTSPVISPVRVDVAYSTAMASWTALVVWLTDENSTSQVEFGLTSSYGTITPLDSSGAFLRTVHSIILSPEYGYNLQSNTIYHYRMISKDASYNTTVSGDHTFTTPASTTSSSKLRAKNLATISKTLNAIKEKLLELQKKNK